MEEFFQECEKERHYLDAEYTLLSSQILKDYGNEHKNNFREVRRAKIKSSSNNSFIPNWFKRFRGRRNAKAVFLSG